MNSYDLAACSPETKKKIVDFSRQQIEQQAKTLSEPAWRLSVEIGRLLNQPLFNAVELSECATVFQDFADLATTSEKMMKEDQEKRCSPPTT